MTVNYPFFFIRCEHQDYVDVDFDLIVRAEDEADALVLWREYYVDELEDQSYDEPKVRLLDVPEGRGAVPWN